MLAEQEKMKKALGEAGICIQELDKKLQNHAAGLLNHQDVLKATSEAILRLWREAGLTVKEVPQARSSSQVN
jgi:hypothetical protein